MKPWLAVLIFITVVALNYIVSVDGQKEVVCPSTFTILEGQIVFPDGPTQAMLTGCFIVVLCLAEAANSLLNAVGKRSIEVPVRFERFERPSAAKLLSDLAKPRDKRQAAFHCFSESMVINPPRTLTCTVGVIPPGGSGKAIIHFKSDIKSFEDIVDIDIIGQTAYTCVDLGVGTETIHISGKCIKGEQTLEKLKSIAGIGAKVEVKAEVG